MTRLPRFLVTLTAVAAAAPGAQAQSVMSSFSYNFDVRQAGGRPDRLGVDFTLQFERARAIEDPRGHHFSWSAAAEGFRALGSEANDVDYMAVTVALDGRHYSSALTPLPARVQDRFLDLLARDSAGGGPGLTDAEAEELNGLVTRSVRNRRFFTYDVHYRFETDQDLDRTQHVLGASFAAELPFLHHLLDAIPAETRHETSRYRPQPVRIYVGVEYVGGIDDVAADGTPTGETSGGRVRVEAAWGTHVLDELVVRARWQGHLLIAPPVGLDTRDREINSFVEVWGILPLGARTGVLIKYIDGRMPPAYDDASVGAVGFSISLQ